MPAASAVSWPPHLAASDEAALLSIATDYALSHGLVYRPSAVAPSSHPSTTSAIHAPYALYPALFSRALFERATELQVLYNRLYAMVATDEDFLREVVGGKVVVVDEFQRELYGIWDTVLREGSGQVRDPCTARDSLSFLWIRVRFWLDGREADSRRSRTLDLAVGTV